MVVSGISRIATSPLPARRAAGPSKFGVRAERASEGAAASPLSAVAITSLLAMQEADSEEQRDREARQHGEAVMEELAGLQCSLLGGDGPDLERLAQLAQRPVEAADPGLGAILRAIRLRAAVELARHDAAPG